MKIALTIAGSDPSSGAGIQGDLRTFAALSVHALTAITCITAQGTRGVRAVAPLSPKLVRQQIDVVLSDVTVDVIKLGALATAGIARAVAASLRGLEQPLVIDPVMASSSGARLLDDRGVRVLLEVLMPRATVITPNVAELMILTDARRAPRDVEALGRLGERLRARGANAVLAKGGHLAGAPNDVLVDAHGTHVFPGKRLVSRCTHGTGCALASAIAAHLAQGLSLVAAVRASKAFVARAIAGARPIGEGASPLDPFAASRPDRVRARRPPRAIPE